MEEKKCSKCFEQKSLDEFYIERATKDGRNRYCKECSKAAAKRARRARPDHYKKVNNEWRSRNRNHFLETKKQWRLNNVEHCRQYRKDNYLENRDRDIESGRRYKKENRQALKQKSIDEYWSDPEYYRQKQNQYRKENPRIASAWYQARQAAKRNALPKWADQDKIREIYRQSELITQETGVMHEVDHIVPLQSDLVCGLHVESNLQILPQSENRRKCNVYWPDMP